jgi:hypothetical protein
MVRQAGFAFEGLLRKWVSYCHVRGKMAGRIGMFLPI